jgi:hypothetical protein
MSKQLKLWLSLPELRRAIMKMIIGGHFSR